MRQKAEVVLTAKDETQAAFNSVNANFSGLLRSAAAMLPGFAALTAALSAASIVGMVKGIADVGDQLQKLSIKTDIAVEELSKLQYAASLSDLSNEDLGASLTKLNMVMGDAANGSKEAAAALARFGIAPSSGLSTVAALQQIADRVKATGDATKVASGLNDIFGRSFAGLVPLLKGGSAGIKSAGDELERMGGVMSGDLARSSEAFNDNLTKLSRSLDALKVSSLSGVVQGLEKLTNELIEGSHAAGGFLAALNAGATLNPFKSTSQNLKTVRADLEEIERVAKDSGYMDEARYKRKMAQLALLKIEQRNQALAGSANYGNEGRARGASSEPGILNGPAAAPKKAGRAAAAQLSDYDRILKSLSEQIAIKELDLQGDGALTAGQKEAVKILVEMRDGTIKTTEAERASLAGKLEKLLTIEKEIAAMDRENKALDEAQLKLAAHLDALDAEARQLEKQAEMYGLTEAQISAITQARILEELAVAKSIAGNEEQIAVLERELAVRGRITDALSTIDTKKIEQALEAQKSQFDLFAENAAKGMQSAFADFLFDPFAKGTRGMLQGFGETIKRMIAEAVAADLTRKMFGSVAEGGKGDGWLSALFNLLPKFDVGTPYVPFDMPAIIHKGERIIPAAQNKPGASGQGASPINITVQVNGAGNAPDVRRAAGQGAREAMVALSGAGRYR